MRVSEKKIVKEDRDHAKTGDNDRFAYAAQDLAIFHPFSFLSPQ
jgi:hypothetical protein